jgi:hypothetical protein
MALQGKKERSGGGKDGVLESPKRRKVGAVAGKQKPTSKANVIALACFIVIVMLFFFVFLIDFLLTS